MTVSSTMQVGGKGLSATLVLLDASGNQTAASSPPVWSSSDVAIATVVPAGDGMSAQIMPVGATGTVTIAALVGGTIHITSDIEVTPGVPQSGQMVLNPN